MKAKELIDLIQAESENRPFIERPDYDEYGSRNTSEPPTLLGLTIENSHLHMSVTKITYLSDIDIIGITNKFDPTAEDIDFNDLMLLLAKHPETDVKFMKYDYPESRYVPYDIIGLRRDYMGENDDDDGFDYLMFIVSEKESLGIPKVEKFC